MGKASPYSPSLPANGVASRHGVDASKQNGSPVSGLPEGSPELGLDVPVDGRINVVPFEFRALEVCLESACRCLESEV